ncbi:hypothetical protein IscW_ISCW010658 [Ixodes scapularis]|uniref:Uncharacterized protein n=1 Tax=Ixodes scapularis TaxID=6945 RepID=B7Q9S1_IXOSC|nr:hypothetical protein IscW_ISCW010658 [Ixodes scapularis]|eukprot:XP_002406321.1 hypothetical protein IscW_ISCW010658 [Ixodes scapularis]
MHILAAESAQVPRRLTLTPAESSTVSEQYRLVFQFPQVEIPSANGSLPLPEPDLELVSYSVVVSRCRWSHYSLSACVDVEECWPLQGGNGPCVDGAWVWTAVGGNAAVPYWFRFGDDANVSVLLFGTGQRAEVPPLKIDHDAVLYVDYWIRGEFNLALTFFEHDL